MLIEKMGSQLRKLRTIMQNHGRSLWGEDGGWVVPGPSNCDRRGVNMGVDKDDDSSSPIRDWPLE